MTLTDHDVMALTLWAEARGEPIEGRIGIACVIRNRVNADLGSDHKPDWWGEGYTGVCRAPWQFSCWNQGDDLNHQRLINVATMIVQGTPPPDPILRECYWIAEGVMSGTICDRVGKSTHYHATYLNPPPAWTKGATLVCRVGSHLFFSGVK
jgi:N-acetylmuramoyl-L-alanine amidase